MTQAKALSVLDLQSMKRQRQKISCLTVYDASFSAILDQAGIDVLLVGDSLGMVIQGHRTTVPVTLEQVLYHTVCVCRGRRRAFVIADLPFLGYYDVHVAIENAGRLLREAGAQMVKLEGARPQIVAALVEQGIPVCAHLGLLPQSINLIGEYRAFGKTPEDAELILQQAIALERAGANLMLLECVPAGLAQQITESLRIPVIGIGAGSACDGQILVLYDMLNITGGKLPKFAKNFMQGAGSIQEAAVNYHHAVKQGLFPAPEHGISG